MADSPRILSTLFGNDPPMAAWQDRVDLLRPFASDARTIRAVVRRAPRYDALILDGSARRDQIAALLLRAKRGRQAIVITDATWMAGARRLERVAERWAMRIIDNPNTRFCVHSRFETETFPRTWRLRASSVHFTPWPVTRPPSQLEPAEQENGRVFAGGISLRDHDTLIDAAGGINAPIDIATTSPLDAGSLPSNVWLGAVERAEYDRMLAAAAVVVVALKPHHQRSSGQTTYVNAMAQGKAIVVTDVPGVRDYITDGQTGVIVPPGDSAALARAVQRLLDDPDERRRLGQKARDHALRNLSLTQYAMSLLAVVDDVLGGA